MILSLLAIVVCVSMGACVGMLVMACLVAAGRADDWAETVHDAEMDKRETYNALRARAQR